MGHKQPFFAFKNRLARDGVLLPGVGDITRMLARDLVIHVVTGDTFGCAAAALSGYPCQLTILDGNENQGAAKLAFIEALGPSDCACIGNGRNDSKMVAAAGIGIAVIGPEGAATEIVKAAAIVVSDIRIAQELVLHPLRLVATLRS
ncbi:MAG: HAD hydrolase family protein [Rhodomicrobium sp.]